MTRIHGILTLAAAMALAGCQSSGDMWNASSDQPNRAWNSSDTTSASSLNSSNTPYNSSTAYNSASNSASSDNTMGTQNLPNHPNSINNPTAPASGNMSASANMSNNLAPAYSSSTPSNNQVAANNQPNNQSVQPADASAGQLTPMNDKTPSANLSVNDRNFVTAAAAGGMFEIQSGQIALTNSNSDEVKRAAQRMIDDHTKANDQLKAIAKQNGFALDGVGLTTDQRNDIDQLNKAKGAQFDQTYLTQQKTAHEETIAKFQQAASSADKKELRDWAAQTLPTLREHLAMINNDLSGNIGSER